MHASDSATWSRRFERDSQSDSTDRADAWLGLGAAGRMLADPTFTDVLSRSAKMARAANNEVLLAEAAALTTWPGAFFFIAENPHHEMIDVCEAALATLRADDPMRVRVLATLASNLTFASEPHRRMELIREAHELASAHDDPALTGAVLNAEFICMWEPGTLERRQHIGQMVTAIGARTGDAELTYIGGFFEAYCDGRTGFAGRGPTASGGAARGAARDAQPVLRVPGRAADPVDRHCPLRTRTYRNASMRSPNVIGRRTPTPTAPGPCKSVVSHTRPARSARW